MTTWRDAMWLCIDTETTGLGEDAKILEIGLVAMRGGRVRKARSILIDPQIPIPPESTAIHGIGAETVAGCPTIAQVADEVLAAIDRARVIVGYNVLGYDAPILERELGPLVTDALILDPLVIVRDVDRYVRGQGRHRLTTTATRHGLDHDEPGMLVQAHRAEWDATLAGRIAWHLRARWPDDPAALTAWQEAARKRQDSDFQSWLAKQPPRDTPGATP